MTLSPGGDDDDKQGPLTCVAIAAGNKPNPKANLSSVVPPDLWMYTDFLRYKKPVNSTKPGFLAPKNRVLEIL